MHRYHDTVDNVSQMVAIATESIQKRDSFAVSCSGTMYHTLYLFIQMTYVYLLI